MEAILAPASPLPDLSLPDIDEDAQTIFTPVPFSVMMTWPLLFPEKLPPGFTVQVVAVVAPDDVAPRLTVRATAAVATSPLLMSFRVWIRSSSAC